jgi:hypothetical protein
MLAVKDRWWRRKLREAIEIEKETWTINIKFGTPLSRSWPPNLNIPELP